MKVVIAGLYPYEAERITGGVESVIAYLVEGLRKIGTLDIHIVCCKRETKEDQVVNRGGITIHFLPSSQRLGNLTFGAADRRRIIQKIHQLNPEIVHAHSQDTYASAALATGRPAVITVHGLIYKELDYKSGALDKIRKYPRVYLESYCLKRAKEIISISPYVNKTLADKTNARMHLIENPISERYFELIGDEVPGRILFAGSICRRKNLLDLLKAVNLLKEKSSDVQLSIAGPVEEQSYFDVLNDYVKRNALDRYIAFLGHMTEGLLMNEYKRCSLLVLPSAQETAPMAIQQAMAAGKPVVATRVGGVPYLVADGETGFLVELGDVQGLADKMGFLLRNQNLRTKMGENGKLVAKQRFTTEIVARQTQELYKGILDNKA